MNHPSLRKSRCSPVRFWDLWIGLLVLALPPLFSQAPSFRARCLAVPATFFESLAVADMNGNGFPDLIGRVPQIQGVPASFDLAILYDPGAPNAIVPSLQPLPVSQTSALSGGLNRSVFPGDFDGDGAMDLLVDFLFFMPPDQFRPLAVLVRQSSPGVFSLPMVMNGLGFAEGAPIAAADINDDGIMDVVCAGGVFTLSGSTWSAAFSYSGFAPFSGDFNGDGATDFAWYSTNPDAGPSPIHIRSGAAPSPLIILPGLGNSHVVAGDIDFDGHDDIVVHDRFLNTLRVFGAASPGQWPSLRGTFPTSNGPLYISSSLASEMKPLQIADVDGDGRAEVMKFVDATNFMPFTNPNSMFVEWQNVRPGAPSMPYRPLTLSSYTNLTRPQLADFDLDGDMDFVISDANGVFPVLYENQARYGAACPGSTLPVFSVANSYIGSPGLNFLLSDAPANVLVYLVLSTNAAPAAGCGIHVGISPSALILPGGSLIAGVTPPSGQATFSAVVPNNANLSGFSFAAQWVLLDPLGALTLATLGLSTTEARTLTLF